MKEVIETLSQRFERLKNPFSPEWLSEFSLLMEFIQNNTHTDTAIKSIEKEKQEAHVSLAKNLQSLFLDGKKCLQNVLQQIKNSDAESTFKPQIQALIETKVDKKKIADPFFKFETAYCDYIASFSGLLEGILKSNANAFVKGHATVDGNLQINLSFSPFLKSCSQDIEVLSGLRTKAIWGKWDLILQWEKWTKNGISPGNHPFKKNLFYHFESLKISEAVQCCGSFFQERLFNKKRAGISSEVCIKALELYLDKDDQYWIIAHFAGEDQNKKPFFIKKLQRSAQSYALLNLLLNTEAYSPLDFPRLTHTLGELEIKKELKKVFFSHSKFAGSLVQLGGIKYPIDASAIIEQLTSLEAEKKHLPGFKSAEYLIFKCNV